MLRRFIFITLLLIGLAIPAINAKANMNNWFYVLSGETTAIEDLFLDDVIASVVYDVSAVLSSSYPGSGQKWFNGIASPADSSAQSANDFFLGEDINASTDDPAFNGSAGDQAAFWSFDSSNDFFRLAGSNTALLNSLHKTTGGSDFWVVMTFNRSDNTWNFARFWATAFSVSSGNDGIILRIQSTEKMDLFQVGESATTSVLSDVVSSPAGDHIVIWSHSHSTNISRFWVDSTTAEADDSHTFATSTTNPVNDHAIASNADGTSDMALEDRLYDVAFGNEFLDNTKAAAIINHLCLRRNVNYTGGCL